MKKLAKIILGVVLVLTMLITFLYFGIVQKKHITENYYHNWFNVFKQVEYSCVSSPCPENRMIFFKIKGIDYKSFEPVITGLILKDNTNVYHENCDRYSNIIDGANPETFTPITEKFFIDEDNVFYLNSCYANVIILEELLPNGFEVLSGQYIKDINHTYYFDYREGEHWMKARPKIFTGEIENEDVPPLIKNISTRNSVSSCRNEWEKKGGKLYYYGEIFNTSGIDIESLTFITCVVAKDKDDIFIGKGLFSFSSLERVGYQIDVNSFDKICDEDDYCQIFTSSSGVYCLNNENKLVDLGINSQKLQQKYMEFERSEFSMIGEKIFFNCIEVKGTDTNSFKPITGEHFLGRDKDKLYIGTKQIPSININTFKIINYYDQKFIKDDKDIYAIFDNYSQKSLMEYQYIKINTDPTTFSMLNDSDSNIFKDGKGNVFYGCQMRAEGGPTMKDIIKIEDINLGSIDIIQNNMISSENNDFIHGVVDDSENTYIIRCNQEPQITKNRK